VHGAEYISHFANAMGGILLQTVRQLNSDVFGLYIAQHARQLVFDLFHHTYTFAFLFIQLSLQYGVASFNLLLAYKTYAARLNSSMRLVLLRYLNNRSAKALTLKYQSKKSVTRHFNGK
jgi:hypothetical protein